MIILFSCYTVKHSSRKFTYYSSTFICFASFDFALRGASLSIDCLQPEKIKAFGYEQCTKSLYSCLLFAILFLSFVSNLQFDFYTSILSTTIILSTQPYYISILSTQLCHSICSLSLNFKEFDRIENAVKSHLNATNSLKPKPFHTLDFRPVTSTRHTQHGTSG